MTTSNRRLDNRVPFGRLVASALKRPRVQETGVAGRVRIVPSLMVGRMTAFFAVPSRRRLRPDREAGRGPVIALPCGIDKKRQATTRHDDCPGPDGMMDQRTDAPAPGRG